MTTYRFANNALTTLGSAISPTATNITVASGTGSKFPNPGAGQYFTATLFSSPTGLPNEIVLVTARVGDTMTVIRGQEGTTAQSWSVGDTFSNFISAGFLNQLVDAGAIQTQPGNFAVDTGTANSGLIVLSPTPANLPALLGVPIRVKKIGATNTGAYALTITSVGSGNVLIGGLACESGELVASEIFEVIYDGSNFNLISNPGVLHGDRLTANSVANAALAVMTALTVKGNLSGGTTTPYDIPLAALRTAILGSSSYVTVASYGPIGYRRWSDGYVEQWGYVTGSYPSETVISTVFPYTGWIAADNIVPAPKIAFPSNTPDHWIQLIDSSISTSGFSVQVQGEDATSAPISGFTWTARGRDS